MDPQHLDARPVTTNDLDVGFGDAERFREELSERFVGRTVDRRRRERDFEGAILNANDTIATRSRCDADLERDRPILLSNVQLAHRITKPT